MTFKRVVLNKLKDPVVVRETSSLKVVRVAEVFVAPLGQYFEYVRVERPGQRPYYKLNWHTCNSPESGPSNTGPLFNVRRIHTPKLAPGYFSSIYEADETVRDMLGNYTPKKALQGEVVF